MKKAREQVEQKLLNLLNDFVKEMGSVRALNRVSLIASFENDLGIDSLARIEFIYRIENYIGYKLPLQSFAEAQNLNDILIFLRTHLPAHVLSQHDLHHEYIHHESGEAHHIKARSRYKLNLAHKFLKGKSLVTMMVRPIKQFSRLAFTIYTALITIPIFAITFLLISLSNRKTAQTLIKICIKVIFFLCGWPIKIQNPSHLLEKCPMIYVANHSSYIDALIMIALLPKDFVAVGKREILNFKPLQWIWNKLGHLTVDRNDITNSLSDLEVMKERLHSGYSLMIFPEGTFYAGPGIRPFKSGAFKLSIDTQTPICPIAIQGAREILPDNGYLLRPKTIRINVIKPLIPESGEWPEVLRLKTLARQDIGNACGEALLEKH